MQFVLRSDTDQFCSVGTSWSVRNDGHREREYRHFRGNLGAALFPFGEREVMLWSNYQHSSPVTAQTGSSMDIRARMHVPEFPSRVNEHQ